MVGTGFAHRIVGRVLAGNAATLEDNATSSAVAAAVQSEPAIGPGTLNDHTRTAAEAGPQATYQAMGWDFDDVWTFGAGSGRSELRVLRTTGSPGPAGAKVR